MPGRPSSGTVSSPPPLILLLPFRLSFLRCSRRCPRSKDYHRILSIVGRGGPDAIRRRSNRSAGTSIRTRGFHARRSMIELYPTLSAMPDDRRSSGRRSRRTRYIVLFHDSPQSLDRPTRTNRDGLINFLSLPARLTRYAVAR